MSGWKQDQQIEQARVEFDARYADWLTVAPADRRLPTRPTSEQQAAYDRMQAADTAYTNCLLSVTGLDSGILV
jgi:hypothetical protein